MTVDGAGEHGAGEHGAGEHGAGEYGAGEYDGYTFEQLVEALEQLTERMAAGDIGIEEAADLYERAQLLHGLAEERLHRVQERIEKLTPGDGP